MAATGVRGGEIFIMTGSGQDDPFSDGKPKSKYQKANSNQRPTNSLRGVSMFQDPDAGAALPRDVEVSLSLYESENKSDAGDRLSTYSQSSTTSSKMITPMPNGNSIADTTPIPNGTFKKDTEAKAIPKPAVPVKKAGSFQMKSAYPTSGLSRTESTNSQKEKSTPGESYSRMYKAKTTVEKKTTSTKPAVSSTTVSKQGSFSMNSTVVSSSKQSSSQDMPLKIATSGQRVTQKQTAVEIEQSKNDSKDSLSSTESDPLSDPSPSSSSSGSPIKEKDIMPVMKAKVKPSVVLPPSPASDESNKKPLESTTSNISSTSSLSIDSVVSEASSTPTVVEMDITPVPKSDKSSGKSIDISVSKATSSSTKATVESETSSLTTVSQISETNSVVRNKEFKAKMNQMMSSQVTPDRGKQVPPPKPKLNIDTAKAPDTTKADTPVSSAPPDDGVKLYKGTPTSPIVEMKDTIKTGTVERFAKSGMFKHLTGRSIDQATLERKKAMSASSPTSPTSPGEKKYKFVVEGIDVPATEKEDEGKKESVSSPIPVSPPPPPPVLGPNGIPLPPPPPPPPPGTVIETETETKTMIRKKGFSYVLDEKLASAIVKKAEDVTARKAYEAVEVKVQSTTKTEEKDESEVLVKAKAQLHKRDSLEAKEPTSPPVRSPNEDLLKEIQARFGNRLEEEDNSVKTASSTIKPTATNEPVKVDSTEPKQTVTAKISNSQSFKAVSKSTEEKGDIPQSKTTETEVKLVAPPKILVRQSSIDDSISIETSKQRGSKTTHVSNPQSSHSGTTYEVTTSTTTVSQRSAANKTSTEDKFNADSISTKRQEDVADSNVNLKFSQRPVSQQDIINAALTSEKFRKDYQKQQVFTSSTDNKPPQSKPSVTAENKAANIEAGHKRELPPEAETAFNQADSTTRVTRQQWSSGEAIKTSAVTDRDIDNNQSSDAYIANDNETTTWNLTVDNTTDDEQLSQFSSVSNTSKRRVPFENIRSSQGVVKIDLGETEVDEVDQEVNHVTDRLSVDIVNGETYSGYSGSATGGLHVNIGQRSATGSHIHSSSQRDLPPDQIVYHVQRRERSASRNSEHSHQDYLLNRHLSPPPAPGYFRPVQSLQGSRAASRSNSSLLSHPRSVSRQGEHHQSNSLYRTGSGVVNLLKPLTVDVSQVSHHRELKTHPTGGVSPGYNMSAPAVTANPGAFDTSQMQATSTLHRQVNANEIQNREVLNYNSSAMNTIERDVNMNIRTKTSTSRGLPGEYGSRGRTPVRRGSGRHVANVSYSSGEMPVYDTLDGSTGKYRVQRVMDRRRAANEMAIPLDVHPDVAYKKQKFYSVARENRPGNRAIVAAAPQLEEANKSGDKYNVTLKLNTSQMETQGNSIEREERQEYEEKIRLQRQQQQMRAQRADQLRMEQMKLEGLIAERDERLRIEQIRNERMREEREEQLRIETLRMQRQREEEEEKIKIEHLKTLRLREEKEEREEQIRLERLRAERIREEMEEREEQFRLEQIRAERLRQERAESEEYMRLEQVRAERMHAERMREEQRRVMSPAGHYVATAQVDGGAPVDHISFKNYHGPKEGIVTQQRQQHNESGTHIVTDIGSRNAQQSTTTSPGGEQPRFTMFIDQTMKMDYVPPGEAEEPAVGRQAANPVSRGRQQPDNANIHRTQQRTQQRQQQSVDEMMVQGGGNSMQHAPQRNGRSPLPVDESMMQGRSSNMQHASQRNGRSPLPVDESMMQARGGNVESAPPYMNGHRDTDDLENYFSPAEDDDEDLHTDSMYPQVVRGSILIKNSIDTTGGPKVFDVVDGDSDSEDGPVCDDNTNMFQGNYFQARENPMYNSDQDLSKLAKEPQFTSLFNNPNNHGAPPQRAPNGHISDNESDIAIPVTRETYQTYQANQQGRMGREGTPISEQMQKSSSRNAHAESKRRTTTSSSSRAQSSSQSTDFEISALLRGAPPDSIKQTINVEREEEEIIGPLPEAEDGSDPKAMLNFDTVSEKVDLGLHDGVAQVAVKVRCERVVPIRGVDDMFKKSSVIVTRLIEIDLTSTEERRRLHDNIMNASGQGMIADGEGRGKRRFDKRKLTTKQTFNLYKTFMGLAEADEAGKKEAVQIDQRIEEDRMPNLQSASSNGQMVEAAYNGNGHIEDTGEDMAYEESDTDIDALERRLEAQIATYAKMKQPEPDAESYMSAVSENHSMMY